MHRCSLGEHNALSRFQITFCDEWGMFITLRFLHRRTNDIHHERFTERSKLKTADVATLDAKKWM